MQRATLSIVLQVQSPEHRLSADALHHLHHCPSATGTLEVILLHHHCQITSLVALEERNIQAADRWHLTTGLNVSGTELVGPLCRLISSPNNWDPISQPLVGGGEFTWEFPAGILLP